MKHERSRTAQFAGAVALLASTVLAAACGGSNNQTTVTAPTGTLVTDTFMGTVPYTDSHSAADSHNFTITTSGNALNVTLVSAGPPSTITMGLGVGTPSTTGTCSILPNGSTPAVGGSTAQLNGTNFGAGTYCVVVFDIGNVPPPPAQVVAYTVTVAHT